MEQPEDMHQISTTVKPLITDLLNKNGEQKVGVPVYQIESDIQ